MAQNRSSLTLRASKVGFSLKWGASDIRKVFYFLIELFYLML